MPQSHACVWLHIVFSTKERRSYLQHPEFRNTMFHLIGHNVKQAGCVPIRTGGWHDHIHLVCRLSRTITIADLVETVKVETSKWAKDVVHGVKTFAWPSGYSAFSVSHSSLPRVTEYVERQEEHHTVKTFQEEYRELCRRHEVPLDERYAWD